MFLLNTGMNRRTALKTIVTTGAAGILLPRSSAENGVKPPHLPLQQHEIQFWLETSLKRVYPISAPANPSLELLAARNEKISFQACFRNLKTNSVRMRCELLGAAGLKFQVRRVGFVPLPNFNTYVPKDELEGLGFIPGLCPDPLFPESTANIGPEGNGVFWISLAIPEDIEPGLRRLTVRFTLENQFAYTDFVRPVPWSMDLPVQVDVRSLVIQPRRDFSVTHWISADSIWEYYKIEPCGERFWELADAYIEDLITHNVDVVYTPIFNNRHEILVRPAQLLRVHRTGPDVYEFDFTDVRRWVRIALKHGAAHLEFPHFFTPAPTSAKYPQHIFERDAKKIGPMLWPTEISATSDTYRRFLEQFIPQFKAFLEEENILDKSFFHCADEPDGDVQIADYRKSRAMLRELAPWMKVMDAMSDPRFATDHLTDMPVPSIVTAPEFTKAHCPAWAYFCCGPRGFYLQRLLDTPLPKIRMAGWLFYKLGAKGFLHWGHNYWFVFCSGTMDDPFNDASVGAWPGEPYGDPFVVYPGANGPIDSIRWEVLAESFQDYALLQSAGIKPDDPLLDSLKDYQTFPKTENWLAEARRKILMRS